MSGKVLLDTNIVIAHFKDDNIYFDKLLESSYYVSQITVGELYAGAYHSVRPEHHCQKIDDFLKHGKIIETDIKSSQIYGEIWAELAQKGKPIPTNDIWIASLSIQHNIPLITNDKHFDNIDLLSFESW